MLVLGVAGPALAQGDSNGEARSLGAAGLLLDGQVTGSELARWAELLGDARPLWRASGARLAMVSGAPALVPALLAAIETETDPAAAREEMLALGRLAPGSADEALFQAAQRFSGDLDGALARSLALRGDTALAVTPRLQGRKILRQDWDAHFAWATANGRRAVENAASAALATGDPGAWAAFLATARQGDHVIDEATLARSVKSDSARFREETYWHLLLADHPGPKEGSALSQSLAAAPEASDDAEGVAAFAFELLGRTLGRPARDWTARLEALATQDSVRLPVDLAILLQLRDTERDAYGRLRFVGEGEVERRIDSGSDPGGGLAPSTSARRACERRPGTRRGCRKP